MEKTKYLIIGAGITGLTLANCLGEKCLVLEKESEPGGYCRSIYKDGYIWDYSGHFFHFNNQKIKEYFIENVGSKNIIKKKKNTKIYYKKKLIDYPFQSNIHQLEKREFIDCLYDFMTKETRRHYDSFEQMLYGKYGKSITNKFLRPYNEKVYACPLSYLDKNAMGRFFPNTGLNEIIQNMKQKVDKSYNQEFFYPKDGAMSFVNSLIKRSIQDKILYNEEVIKIDAKSKIAYTNNNSYRYEVLINTGSIKQFLKEIGINNKSNRFLTSNKVVVYNIGFDKKSKLDGIDWIYIPDKRYKFYRVGFYDNIFNSDKMSIYVELGERTDESINYDNGLSEIINSLKEIGIVDDQKMLSYSLIEMNPAYIHVNREASQYVKSIKSKLATKSIYSIGRYGSWKYCSIEDCMIEAIETSEVIRNL